MKGKKRVAQVRKVSVAPAAVVSPRESPEAIAARCVGGAMLPGQVDQVVKRVAQAIRVERGEG